MKRVILKLIKKYLKENPDMLAEIEEKVRADFAKVFEGNYLDKSGSKPQSYMEKIQNRVSEVDNWV